MATGNRDKPRHEGRLPVSGSHPLPAKAEAALREAGIWDDQFERDLATLDASTLAALSVIGTWDDHDQDEMETALYEIGHRTPPSPPVEFPW